MRYFAAGLECFTVYSRAIGNDKTCKTNASFTCLASLPPDAAYDQREVGEELQLIEAIRRQMARILHSLTDGDIQRICHYSEDGPTTLATLFERITDHILHHVRLIKEKNFEHLIGRGVLCESSAIFSNSQQRLSREESDMLVLSRKTNQQIVIGDDIVVSILRIAGNRVRIGIEAPESMHIVRGELELVGDDPRILSLCVRLGVEHECHEPASKNPCDTRFQVPR